METVKEEKGSQIIFHLPERLDTLTAGEFEKQLDSTPPDTFDELIIDMTETVYISSIGLRLIMMISKKYGEKLILRNVSDDCRAIFRAMGLMDLFVIQ